MLERTVVGVLAFGGFLISFYFAQVNRKPNTAIERFVPALCRLDKTTCGSLLSTPEAQLFGIPNFHLGLLFYTALIGSALLPALWHQLHLMLFFGSLVTIGAGVYLTYILLIRLKIRCTLCLASHAINLLIFVALLASL
jgi:uncharacterized membrane protein